MGTDGTLCQTWGMLSIQETIGTGGHQSATPTRWVMDMGEDPKTKLQAPDNGERRLIRGGVRRKNSQRLGTDKDVGEARSELAHPAFRSHLSVPWLAFPQNNSNMRGALPCAIVPAMCGTPPASRIRSAPKPDKMAPGHPAIPFHLRSSSGEGCLRRGATGGNFQ